MAATESPAHRRIFCLAVSADLIGLASWANGDFYVDMARSMERACFDFMMIEDTVMVADAYGGSMEGSLKNSVFAPKHDPLPLAVKLAAKTSKLGVVATLSTSFYPPYLLARACSTVDSIAGGRFGWNIVSSAEDRAAQNFGLDKLYEFVRGQAVPLLAAPQDTQRITIGLANSPEPGAWRLLVRGDLIQWGKLGPQRVPFEEFLRLRLEASGEVRTIVPGQSGPADLVVMPIGVPHPDHVLDAVAAAAAHAPLLLPVQPVGARPMKQWPLFVQQMRARGIGLPAVDDPVRTIAVLRQATGTTTVYLAAARQQWGYLAMLHHVLRYSAPAVTFPHLDPSGR